MSTRSTRFTSGLLTGYAAIGVNILYTLLSVRLALCYLGKEEFGLWALALQISGYMGLLEFGISSAISRFLADHKDAVNGGDYGSFLLTGCIVFALQGGIITIAGAAFSFLAPDLFHIPHAMAPDFRWVLVIITSLSGFSIATRSLGVPLWAFQRMDITNLLAILTLIVSLGTLWFGFNSGFGIYSLAYAGIPTTILSPGIVYIVCSRNGYYPSCGSWGKPRWEIFKKLFSFGKDVLLMSIGSQAVNASQIMILSRIAGLDAAATFSVGTKIYTMGQQFVGKVIESSAPGLTEIFVRGDRVRFNERFWNIVNVTAFLATIGASALIMGNQMLVSLWTSAVIHWTLTADIILAGLLITTSISRCLISISGILGDLRPVRHIYLLEGGFFILIAIPLTRHFGIIGILGASLLAHLSITLVIAINGASHLLETLQPLPHLGLGILIISFINIVSIITINYIPMPIMLFYALSLSITLVSVILAWQILLTRKIKSDVTCKIIGWLSNA